MAPDENMCRRMCTTTLVGVVVLIALVRVLVVVVVVVLLVTVVVANHEWRQIRTRAESQQTISVATTTKKHFYETLVRSTSNIYTCRVVYRTTLVVVIVLVVVE